MEASYSSPQQSIAAASPVHVDAALSCASTEQPLDSALVAIPPTGMETGSGVGTARPPFPPEDVSSSQTKKLVVTISVFKETLSVSDEFSCQREVTVVQQPSTSRETTKRLQKPWSTAWAKKYFCLAVPSAVSPSTPSNSPQHASVVHAVPDSVVPGTPPSSRRPGKITLTKHIREWRLLTSSNQWSATKSPSSATLTVAQCHLVDASVVCQDVSTLAQPAVATTNRFSLLGDEIDDLESLAGTVVDPFASPLLAIGAAESVGSTTPPVGQVPAMPSVTCGESVAAACQSSATASPSEPSLQLHLSISEQSAEPVAPLALPPPVRGAVEPSPGTPVPSFEPVLDAASSAAEFPLPPVPFRQVLVPVLASGSTVSPAAGSAYSFALAASSGSPLPGCACVP